MSAPAHSKQSIRKSIRVQREALSIRQVRLGSDAGVTYLLRHPAVRRARRIGIYFPHLNEIDPTLLLRRRAAAKKKFFVPVVMSLRFEPLRFAPLARARRMVINRFGIAEPDMPAKRMLRARQLDVLLVPLVAFDAAGHRLGFGAGFYDRTLAYLRLRRHWIKPKLIGFAYAFQQRDAIPADPWDVGLTAIVTEKGVIHADSTCATG